MADVTRTIHVRVLAFDPVQGRDIPVPGASVLCEDRGWLWDPNLSSGNDTTGADGHATVKVTYDADREGALNPFFTIGVPEPKRRIPAGMPADKQLTLPDEWTTRHYVNHRIANLARHENPDEPLDLHVGLRASLRVSYSDFDPSGIRNPLALPEDTVGVHLADHDEFLFIDWLNPDDTLMGVGYDPRADRLVPAGENDRYPYFDIWPTAPSAMDGAPAAARAWVDPPGAPVGQLGGGSFNQVGPIAVDLHGFVFIIDGREVQRFYPDGTLCQTLGIGFGDPRALAVDQYRTLYVADASGNRIAVIPAGPDATYPNAHPVAAGTAGPVAALAVVPTRAVDAPEMLALADPKSGSVRLLEIRISAMRKVASAVWEPAANRMDRWPRFSLAHVGTFAVPPATGVAASEPVALAAGPGVLFVADRASHRVSRWRVNSAGGATHEADWGRTGGGAGGGAGEFDGPVALALDRQHGYLYVAESGNARVQRLDAAGSALTTWTPAAGAQPFAPGFVAADGRGDVFVTDTANARVLRASAFDPSGVPRAAGDPPAPVGQAWAARTAPGHMHQPEYVALGAGGRLLVADTGNGRVLRFDRTASGDLAPARELTGLANPRGVAEDADGNIYVVEAGKFRVRRYDATGAHVADLGAGTAGAGPDQFSVPRGLAVAQRTEPLLYVADSANSRVQRLQRDGTFLSPLTSAGGVALSGPMDVAVDGDGRVFIADTGNARIVELDAADGFVRAIALPSLPGAAAPRPDGVAIDPDGALLVTDTALALVLRVGRDGKLLAWWNLEAVLVQAESGDDLARQVLFAQPKRAVMDERGLLCVADTGNHRVRLVRTATAIDVALFDLGESLPDMSLRAATKADWTATLGLRLNVGDINVFDDSHDVISDPVDDFAGDAYERTHLLGPDSATSSAINVLRVIKGAQRWYQAHTRTADAERRWGAPGTNRTVDVDLYKSTPIIDPPGTLSFVFIDVNFGRNSTGGRGADAWDDAVVAHEFGHKVFYSVVLPTIPFSIVGVFHLFGEHWPHTLYDPNTAISEGWAEYVEMFFGTEGGPIDRLRGFPRAHLTGVKRKGKAFEHLYGGVETAATAPHATLPTFDAAARSLESEGYVANTLYQIHRALVDPDVLFADAPGYRYGFNAEVTTARAERFDALIWKPLRMWPADPSPEQFDRPTRLYFDNVLRQARALGARPGEVVQSLLELNNMVAPSLSVTLSTGVEPDDPIELTEGESRTLEIRVTDTIGKPLAGYNLMFDGAPVTFPGAGPVPRHGVRGPVQRATDANGIVTVTYIAPILGPPGAPPVEQTLEISYQPDFDTDASFAPPQPGDDRETTLSGAYLYELRAANKTWAGAGRNYGVRVSTKVRFRVTV